MFGLLLGIIYISFISLGLPDALLGSGWPIIHEELNVPVSYAGIVSMIITIGTIISSFFSDKVIRKFGTGLVTAISVAMTAFALFGFSVSSHFWMLCLFSIPYGLGAGSVDAALNNFVALHYKARHMSWLHCFWGIGASLGPVIMGQCLINGKHWTLGYEIVSFLQFGLSVILFCSLFLWKKFDSSNNENKENYKNISLIELLKLPKAKCALIGFFCYCGLELSTGLWGASFMVLQKQVEPEIEKEIIGIDSKAKAALLKYDWPGNIRQLQNCIESSVVMSNGKQIKLEDLPLSVSEYTGQEAISIPMGISLEDAEKIIIMQNLSANKGNKSKTADILGIGRKTLHRKLNEYGLELSDDDDDE